MTAGPGRAAAWRSAVAMVLVAPAAWAGCAGGAEAPPPDLLIRDVRVVDGTGRAPYRASVCVDAGRIRHVSAETPAGCRDAERVIDGDGGTLIPGLWDVHVHLAEDGAHEDALRTLVTHGVTTARDMGGRFPVLDRWRREIAVGERVGPDLVLVGPTINGPGDDSHHLEAVTRAEGVASADSVAALGVDQVKVHRLLPREAFLGVLEGAARHGLPVVGHVPRGVSAVEACEAGMAEVAHLSALLEAAVRRGEEPASGLGEAVAELAGERGEALYRCLAARDGAVTPNLVAYAALARTAERQEAAMTRRLVDRLGAAVRRLHDAGVTVMTRSDAPGENGEIPWGASVHEELELLVEAGLEPIEALVAATAAPARFTGRLGDVGTVETGKQADLLLLGSDPLRDISATRDIRWVVLDGRPVARDDE